MYAAIDATKKALIAPNTRNPAKRKIIAEANFTIEEKICTKERLRNFNEPCKTPNGTDDKREKNKAEEVIVIKNMSSIFKKSAMSLEKTIIIPQITKDIAPTHRLPFFIRGQINPSLFCPIKTAVNLEKTIKIVVAKTAKILKIDIRDAKIP